jgi:chromosome segregation ATPase
MATDEELEALVAELGTRVDRHRSRIKDLEDRADQVDVRLSAIRERRASPLRVRLEELAVRLSALENPGSSAG